MDEKQLAQCFRIEKRGSHPAFHYTRVTQMPVLTYNREETEQIKMANLAHTGCVKC
ncbi:hypothetical protein B4098_1459 [Heyndrickxia coagulans]|uniref:Uncharacterized protein n=1 Tax=Heyndrickxia coagulans TaxID=1398 RepID=A0A150KGN0_HEYCO|nr:hypothetical protein B4098_1459 [Heyndrickxia coagulans]KYC71613.1 hypothetical protein B4099_1707 [Heyndrickxia coagulans]